MQDQSLGLDPLNPESTTVDLHQQRAFVSVRDQIWLYDTLIELGFAADGEIRSFSRRAPRLTFCWSMARAGISSNASMTTEAACKACSM